MHFTRFNDNNLEDDIFKIQKDSLLQQVLRIHDEPYRYFDDLQIHHMLTTRPTQYLDHLLTLLESLAFGESALELPNKLVFDDADKYSDFRVMPCVIRHPQRIRKTVKLVGTNNHQQQVPDQITVGKAFALDEKENFVSAGFAGCLLSSARTGACVAIAVRLLAGSAQHISIIGAGRVGYYAALYVAALGNTQKISICDNIEDRARNTAILLQQTFPELEITSSNKQEVQADVIVLATDSHQPIYGSNHQPASLVVSVGADTHWQHEVSEQLLGQVDIYVDTLDSFNCGDMRQWHSENRVEENKVTDLLTLLRNKPEPSEPALFISTGSALFDNLTIDYLLENEKTFTAEL
jgi:ornithine cyclodeaminase/alanine dehydrogenase-like protein (mu-crystallin family)